MKFNINDNVRVKLTQSGLDALRKDHGKLFKGAFSYIEPDIDEEGWTTFQLWELMDRLGSHIVMGCPLPFETEIEIEV